MNTLTRAAMDRPGWFMGVTGFFCAVMIALVALPTLAPNAFGVLQPLRIDTDPENMLDADEPVRVFHNAAKAAFDINDLIVVGVINDDHEDGVFNVDTLSDIHALAEFAETVRWTDRDGQAAGVIGVDLIAPNTVDKIEQAGLGAVSFTWLMPTPPQTREQALAVREQAQRIPTLNDTLVSGDGEALALYIPITSKDISYRVAAALRGEIATFDGPAAYHITGLPIAQDQFGVEMFKQMAISAPVAMVLIFALMWLFFRQLNLIVSPMVVAMASVIGAMGLLVAFGNTVHIMSSMIPIFVMPIAVLDAVHILSDFHDRYPSLGDRRKTMAHVMDELWRPMLFTTLTTCAGFASLALTPIPPVQTFGVFVALGVVFAWFFTVTLVPAYVALMPERAFAGFGHGADDAASAEARADHAPLGRLLHAGGRLAVGRAKLVIAAALALFAVAGYGVTRIEINDNPVKWFAPNHDIRVADRALNARFAGTYMAYLTLTPSVDPTSVDAAAPEIAARLAALATPEAEAVAAALPAAVDRAGEDSAALYAALTDLALERQDAATDDASWEAWDDVALALDAARQSAEVFKRPDMLAFIAGLQSHLAQTGLVGKSNALPDVVKTVHRDLFLGEEAAFRLPDTAAGVAQTLITYQNSHRPQDLFRLVTPDYGQANLWLQLTSGDNKDMNAVVAAVDAYLSENPAPIAVDHAWFGLTYINTVWQQKMVSGMLTAFLSSFAVVLVLMVVLFRSVAWGVLSMMPLTVTIAVIYGAIGLFGKDYDMPIAVLSSLSLGLAIDYAIHFNARSRMLIVRFGDWRAAVGAVFGEPARAIARNVVVVGVGFLPLLLAPLVPYQTVGVFISAILVLAGAASLLLLPALITVAEPVLIRKTSALGREPHDQIA